MIIFDLNNSDTWPKDGQRIKWIENTGELPATIQYGVFSICHNSMVTGFPMFFYGYVSNIQENEFANNSIICWE